MYFTHNFGMREKHMKHIKKIILFKYEIMR